MVRPLIDDALWAVIEPLLPAPKPSQPSRAPAGGGAQVPDRHRVRAQDVDVWVRLHEVLLAQLRDADRIDWARAVVDTSSVQAVHGGAGTGLSLVDWRKAGSKHHLLTDGHSMPLTAHLAGANGHDSTQLRTLLQTVPPFRGRRGRPRRRPKTLLADRGYNAEPRRRSLKALRIPMAKRAGCHDGSRNM